MLPSVDLHHICEEFARLGDELQHAADEAGTPIEPEPRVLVTGMTALIDALHQLRADSAAAFAPAAREQVGSDPDLLLTHGLRFIGELATLAERLNRPESARAAGALALPFACWMLRRGVELEAPELVVNAAAALANQLREPDELAVLHGLMTEIVDGVSPATIQRDLANPNRPWRLLLLNRAIVATRSHRTNLMVESFQAICEQLPDDAAEFFREGMGQMEALDYPAPVREVMERYYRIWCADQRLH
jgi:hypothetical protein